MSANPDENRGWDQRSSSTAPGAPPPPAPDYPPWSPTPAPTDLATSGACWNCGRATGFEPTCELCGQVQFLPRGVTISGPGLRLGGYLLEGVLAVCTLGIGWLIWAFIVFQYGQTPAKQLLHMKVVYIPQARTARWWRMFFREFIAKTLIGILAAFTLLIPYFWLLWDRNRQELWDKMATTLVVSDPQDQLRPGTADYSTVNWPTAGA